MDAMVYDGPGWRTGERCGGDSGMFVLAVTYIWPGQGVGISDG
jgi:hypothetical protein